MNETTKVARELLKERDISTRSLAAAIGLSPFTVESQIKQNPHCNRTAWSIEQHLGVAIWTPLAEFQHLRLCSEILGADARLTRFHELRSRAIKLGVPGARVLTSRKKLFAAVLAHSGSGQPS